MKVQSFSCILFTTGAVIFLSIGLTTYLIGCDAKIQPFCINYNIVDGNVTDYIITPHNCTKCLQLNYCYQYEEYTCYDGSVQFTYNRNNVTDHCNINMYSNEDVPTTDYELSYPLGTYYQLYISKTDNNCHFKSFAQELSRVGLVFLCLFAMTVIIGIIYECHYSYKDKEDKSNYPHP